MRTQAADHTGICATILCHRGRGERRQERIATWWSDGWHDSLGAMEAGSRTEPAWTAKYELLCPLAVGGMAELHLVRVHGHGHGEQLAVIKRLRRELAFDHQFVKMFLDEA